MIDMLSIHNLAVTLVVLLIIVGSIAGQEPQLQQRYPRYTVQRQDELQLTFPLTPEFNQTVTVQPDGYVNLQKCGQCACAGIDGSGDDRGAAVALHLNLKTL